MYVNAAKKMWIHLTPALTVLLQSYAEMYAGLTAMLLVTSSIYKELHANVDNSGDHLTLRQRPRQEQSSREELHDRK